MSVTGKRELLTEFWGRNLKEKYLLEDLGIGGRIREILIVVV